MFVNKSKLPYDAYENHMKSLFLFGVQIDDLTDGELREILLEWISASQGSRRIVTPNPEFLLQAKKNESFRHLINANDLHLPDGIGLCYAITALTGGRLEHRHTGVDTLLELANLCAQMQKKMLLIGGHKDPLLSEERLSKTAAYLQTYFPGLTISFLDPGIIPTKGLKNNEFSRILFEKIRQKEPTVLVIGLGQEKQEQFMTDVLPYLPSVRLTLGVGGAFDMLSGVLPRAPESWRRVGFEWLWRLWLEPKRIQRILQACVVFPILVAWSTLKSRQFFPACLRVFREVYHQWNQKI
ncbi:MAG: Glycosyl transferase, WecB/TagA/CpsF family [Candidatus Uhrbacteria bacterium GW2011_GWF2_41_16]|uniref:Glycosyl transferase, WecB/TagA/CpsF family n=2 Tax=Candidatus Uhriibacteriota TaxID=1752732 RepID=A0A0G0VBV9_9BACT|nr:MAG: Glycosyl transferase, WecB/TagA/CpsF family [Candidatus Uhrbacteria bacterium GW2011_GWF2_41_16]